MATNNTVNSPLSGTTGTGNFVGSTSPTITTPTIVAPAILDTNLNNELSFTTVAGAVNFVNITNAATGIGPSINAGGTDTNIILGINGKGTGGVTIKGTGTNDVANPGYVGEYISSVIGSGSAVSLSSGVSKTITSISLTAGDWIVYGVVASNPAASTTTSAIVSSVSLTNNTLPTAGSESEPLQFMAGLSAGAAVGLDLATGNGRMLLTATTTVYLVARVTFAVSTMTAFGFIAARRLR